MRKGNKVFKLLCLMMTVMLLVAACSNDKSDDNTGQEKEDNTSVDTSEGSSNGGADERELETLVIYDVAANYQGVQTGWFGKIVKDKFNLELNIIAPQVSGDGEALYQTRSSSGYLGDIILLDNADLQDCIQAGLIMDITEDIENSEYLKNYIDQYKVFNSALEGNEEGKLYGMPCQITNTSPTTYSDTEIYSSPMMAWDYFVEAGTPEMDNLDDLLDVLEQIQTAHPKNDAGDPAYALSLWDDWDNTSIETVNQITKWYGYEVDGSILLGNQGDMVELTNNDGAYYKMLKFFYDANKRGLVDPDSGTQDWDSVANKLRNKQIHLMWYSWQRGFWNTAERANDRNAFIHTPVADMNYYQTSDTYYGDGRAFAVGSKLDEGKKERIIEFLDWLISPEGLTYVHDGLEGYNYTVNDDGTFSLTDNGYYALMENREVPEEFGGGGYSDGMSQINQWMMAGVSINPNTKETYTNNYWSSYIEENKTTMTNEWSDKYGAETQVEYLQKVGQLDVIPSINMILPSDSTDIALIRSQCGELTCDASWRMIFAEDENEFNEIWDNLKEQLVGFGWDTLVEFDKAKYQKVVDARNTAMGK